MNDPSIDPDDPRLTAYALGELETGAARAEVESLLAASLEARAEVEAVRAMDQMLTVEYATERETYLAARPVDPLPAGVVRFPQDGRRPTGFPGGWTMFKMAAVLLIFAGVGIATQKTWRSTKPSMALSSPVPAVAGAPIVAPPLLADSALQTAPSFGLDAAGSTSTTNAPGSMTKDLLADADKAAAAPAEVPKNGRSTENLLAAIPHATSGSEVSGAFRGSAPEKKAEHGFGLDANVAASADVPAAGRMKSFGQASGGVISASDDSTGSADATSAAKAASPVPVHGAIVRLADSSGARADGIIIASQGLILTAADLGENAGSVTATFPGGATQPATLLRRLPDSPLSVWMVSAEKPLLAVALASVPQSGKKLAVARSAHQDAMQSPAFNGTYSGSAGPRSRAAVTAPPNAAAGNETANEPELADERLIAPGPFAFDATGRLIGYQPSFGSTRSIWGKIAVPPMQPLSTAELAAIREIIAADSSRPSPTTSP